MFLDSPTESDIETYNVYGTKQALSPSPVIPPVKASRSSSMVASPLQRRGVPGFGDSDYRPKRRTTPRGGPHSFDDRPPPPRRNYRNRNLDGFQSDYDYSGKRNRNGHNYIKSYARNPDRQVFIKKYDFILLNLN